MASLDEIAKLRRNAALTDDDPVYTDQLLGGLIDDLGMFAATGQVWQEKAAALAALVDTTESGSSRRLSQLHDQALKMSARYQRSETDDTAGRSFTVGVERV